jgi:hypothetical protein
LSRQEGLSYENLASHSHVKLQKTNFTPSPSPCVSVSPSTNPHLIQASLGASLRAAGTSLSSQLAARSSSRLGRLPSSAGSDLRGLKEACGGRLDAWVSGKREQVAASLQWK